MPEVVITGLGPVAPNGVGKTQFWEALKKGESGIRRITAFDPTEYRCQIAGEVPMDSLKLMQNPLLNGHRDSRSSELALAAAWLALDDAGLTLDDLACRSCGVSVGISTSDIGIVQREHLLFIEKKEMTPTAIVSCFPHASAGQIAKAINCRGNVSTISTGCPSGLYSVIYATECLLNGEAEIMIAGGVDAPLTPLLFASFCASGVLPNGFNDMPEKASRPFDLHREGGVLAEGAGVLVLEEAESARRRGARVYARIAGWGVSNASSLRDLRLSMYSSMFQALQRSGLNPFNVDYICAHAPGDPMVDRAETEAIKELCGDYAYNVPVSSIKSMIGNPLAAAGPLQLITGVLAIQDGFVPPTINYEYPDPRCDLDYVPCRGRTARVDTVMVNLHGFGGSNAAMIITRPIYTPAKRSGLT